MVIDFLVSITPLILNPISIGVYGCLLLRSIGPQPLPLIVRLSLAFAIAGLAGEMNWSLHHLLGENGPPFKIASWWVGKDICFFLMALHLLQNDFKILPESEVQSCPVKHK